MSPIHTKDCNMELGAPRGWDGVRQGECQPLPVRRILQEDDIYTFTSYWMPTDEERVILASGGAISLTVYSSAHPPVAMGVAK